jgi:hypothetical protein
MMRDQRPASSYSRRRLEESSPEQVGQERRRVEHGAVGEWGQNTQVLVYFAALD